MNKRQLDTNKVKNSDWKSYDQLTQRERMKFKKNERFSWRLICCFLYKFNEEGD